MMPLFKKNILLLCVFFVIFNVQHSFMTAVAYAAENTRGDEPQLWLGPEVKIRPAETPVVPQENSKSERSWLSKYKWWVAAGAALIAGAALAGGGGDSKDGGGGEEEPYSGSGTYTGEW